MRMPRPETTRGTLNVTFAAHRLIMRERQGDEPIWTTMDRLLDELLRLRQVQAAQNVAAPPILAAYRPAARSRCILAVARGNWIPGIAGRIDRSLKPHVGHRQIRIFVQHAE